MTLLPLTFTHLWKWHDSFCIPWTPWAAQTHEFLKKTQCVNVECRESVRMNEKSLVGMVCKKTSVAYILGIHYWYQCIQHRNLFRLFSAGNQLLSTRHAGITAMHLHWDFLYAMRWAVSICVFLVHIVWFPFSSFTWPNQPYDIFIGWKTNLTCLM